MNNMTNDRFLIANTTKEEREQIVRDSLGYGIGCEDADDGYDMYYDYIIGKKELAQINAEIQVNYVSELIDDDAKPGCGMGRRH